MKLISKIRKINGREISRHAIRNYKRFIMAYDKTVIGIKNGENYSLLSVLHYYMKNTEYCPGRRRSAISMKAWRLIKSNGKSKWQ